MLSRRTALLATCVVVSLSACGSSGHEASERAGHDQAESTPTRLRFGGLSVGLPAGWDGRIDQEVSGVPTLLAATFALPPQAGDPLRELDADPALDSLGEQDVYIRVVDVSVPGPAEEGWAEVNPPIGISRVHLVGVDHVGVRKGIALARRRLVVNDRALLLLVWFGAFQPTDALLAEANRVLVTLRAGPWRPKDCPPDWPGPWTACPEAAWVARVAERAGFRIVDETGSALVGSGRGWSFHIWATEVQEPLAEVAEREKWRPLGRRAGVLVYGGGDLWRWWAAQGFVFWMHAGPYEGSDVPDLDGLAPLIRASREVPPP